MVSLYWYKIIYYPCHWEVESCSSPVQSWLVWCLFWPIACRGSDIWALLRQSYEVYSIYLGLLKQLVLESWASVKSEYSKTGLLERSCVGAWIYPAELTSVVFLMNLKSKRFLNMNLLTGPTAWGLGLVFNFVA